MLRLLNFLLDIFKIFSKSFMIDGTCFLLVYIILIIFSNNDIILLLILDLINFLSIFKI